MVAELLGWFGAGLSCVISLPQVVRTVRAKQLEGISSATYWLVLANAAAWTAWSLLTGEYAAGFPALVNGPVAVVILHRLAVTRHDTPDPEVQQCVQRSDVPRTQELSTSIPGYSVRACGDGSAPDVRRVQILQAATSKVRPGRPVNFDCARGDGDHNALLDGRDESPNPGSTIAPDSNSQRRLRLP